MKTDIIRIDPENIDAAAMERAAGYIRKKELVAFPTETVYGLGGDAMDTGASKRIYSAKGRPSDNPLIIHIAQTESLYDIGTDIPEAAFDLAGAFWPGPMTLIIKKKAGVPYETTGGLDTVAVRLPSHPIARELIKKSGCFIAAPSANTSGRPSPTKASHVIEDMDGRIACIIDGGTVEIGLESTIIDLTEDIPTILRPGAITLAQVKSVTGEARMDPGLVKEDETTRPKAPGMRYRHYAPRGELTIVEGERQAVISRIQKLCEESKNAGHRTAVISSTESAKNYEGYRVFDIGALSHEEEIAHNLYDILRKLDEEDIEQIYSESFDTPNVGTAIMNRLLKAAGHRLIRV
ncbi:MAG: threonylcarbamoyl-AMP synthase [Lachnospiraceae bacterium]|nr:threonylcarbamoyl-AMP synthase [Lachnospiraceae bacterium]